jgi:hypothetical protein
MAGSYSWRIKLAGSLQTREPQLALSPKALKLMQ